MRYYAYLRVSTQKQDVARQQAAIEDYAKKNNIEIEEYFIDYYTGKTFDREDYQRMKKCLRPGDYVIVKEVDRLGRNWDGIKEEWTELKNSKMNIIIIDVPILSDPLPNETPAIEGLDLRLIKEQILSLMCYSAQKEREKISQRTKEALREKKKTGTKSGRPIGRPKNYYTTPENFVKTLEIITTTKFGQKRACLKTRYPIASFAILIKSLYAKYETHDYNEILILYKQENNIQ